MPKRYVFDNDRHFTVEPFLRIGAKTATGGISIIVSVNFSLGSPHLIVRTEPIVAYLRGDGQIALQQLPAIDVALDMAGNGSQEWKAVVNARPLEIYVDCDIH